MYNGRLMYSAFDMLHNTELGADMVSKFWMVVKVGL